MKVTVLAEDTCLNSQMELVAEHGLSIHIEWEGKQILFDTGATDAFSYNAGKLDIKIKEVDMVVLSHHHYDHGGGLGHFLKENKKSKVYLRNTVFAECYCKPSVFTNQYVGLDKNLIRHYQNRFEFINEFREIFPNVFVITDITKNYPLPKGNRYLFRKEKGKYEHDDFRHELVLVFQDKDGLVVFSGCSHQGILNMIKTVNNHFRDFLIKAWVGGFHLIKKRKFKILMDKRKEIMAIGEEILKYPIQKVYTGHCTAVKAFRVLKKYLGEKLISLSTGSKFEIN